MSGTVFITGTSRGIGKQAVKVFAENGWNVVAHARKQTDEFEAYLTELSELCKVSAMPVYFDMLDTDAMKECVKQLKKDKVVVDALINNAGIAGGNIFQMTPVSVIRNVFDVNLFAQMELTQLVLKIMAKENASIVNVASMTGLIPRTGYSAYGVSKAALIAWTKVLSEELKGKIRVNAIAPGFIDTDMSSDMKKALEAANSNGTDARKLGSASEVAKIIFFLASDNASLITGEVLKADGGWGYMD